MTRATLPHCRPNITRAVHWDGHDFSVTIGFDPHSVQPAEVFADTAKGGQMAATLADACVLVSIALQHGIQPAELAKSLGRTPILWGEEGATQPASPVGAIIEAILAEVRP
jgi:hypothetical protein